MRNKMATFHQQGAWQSTANKWRNGRAAHADNSGRHKSHSEWDSLSNGDVALCLIEGDIH